jgi:hypothetical protein
MNNYITKVATAFQDELTKIAAHRKQAVSAGAAVGLMGGGAALFEWARRMNQDRRMGRAMRVQQSY